MKLRVLGCAGGIGGKGERTTALRVDHDILIDAGTGVADLSLADMAAIDHVFLTHCHIDHIAALPLLVDAVADQRQTPLTIYGTAPVLDLLRRHIFNWAIWPDFSELPSAERPAMRYQTIATGIAVSLGQRRITALPVEHSVPAVGYRLDSGLGSLVFSGDTGPCAAFWQAVNDIDNLRHLIIHCAFANRDERRATLAKHFCSCQLAAELRRLERPCAIHIAHLKPGQKALIETEIAASLSADKVRILRGGEEIEF
ncbi:MAG: 3',5'-cyclic-nucleotide phosphodiesterase [Betaproteobacteria bacterium]|nr:3',5'-cyclic-nucleotide phosphodiesterase [Betaproteobacteria bacterium]MCL2886299.1 3',5'-cyclic-nucleotide phosphodiesterase [Betaproteobacteria bacterium]